MASYLHSTQAIDLDVLRGIVADTTGGEVTAIDFLGLDEFCRTFDVSLADGSSVLARVGWNHLPATILEAEMATMKYIRDRTSIPAPRVLAFELCNNILGSYLLIDKASGVNLETVFPGLTPFEQERIVVQIAHYMTELFQHRFDAIGSLFLDEQDEYDVGLIVRPPFYVDGRAKLDLDRGPFPTAKSYFLACAQRELDCSRILFAQELSAEYQRDLEEARLQVERSMGLLCDLVGRCEGLDDGDTALAPFSLDLHDLSLKSITVASDEPSRIVSIVDWSCITTRPLWHCARLPQWLRPSLSVDNEVEKMRLSVIFKHAVRQLEGPGSLLLRALDCDDTRHALDDITEYDAFKDAFLLVPTLESIAATLPGQEDLDGLSKLLDPMTVTGRVARISLLTRGTNALSLAMSPSLPSETHNSTVQSDEHRILSSIT